MSVSQIVQDLSPKQLIDFGDQYTLSFRNNYIADILMLSEAINIKFAYWL